MNDLLKDIEEFENRYNYKFNDSKKILLIEYLIHLKYLCDKDIYKYEDVIEKEEIYDISLDTNKLSYHNLKSKLPINTLLLKIKKKNIKKLLLELLDYIDKPIEFNNDKDKVLYIDLSHDIIHYYNRYGNGTYISKTSIRLYQTFKAFDEILGINNTYIEKQDISDYKDYDCVYIFDDIPKYRLNRYDNIYNDINKLIRNNKNIVLYTNYSKISNFSDGRIISRYIKTIILNNTKAIMIFNNTESTEISIINYNKDKINSLDKLYNIIKTNRKQKDILVKTTYNELRENNLRIGFNLYQLEKENKVRDINKIIDENTRLLEQLNDINEDVENYWNKLFTK